MATSDRVLVVLAHPDDPEFYCGGTIARWAASGRDITYCLLTRGDKGSDDDRLSTQVLAEIREVEQRAAAKVLGVHEVMFLNELDGYVLPTFVRSSRRSWSRAIQRISSRVVPISTMLITERQVRRPWMRFIQQPVPLFTFLN